MGILHEKTAVITGSTRGFGLAMAKAYAEEGAKVVISSRSKESVDRSVEALRKMGAEVKGIPCDVSDKYQIEQLLQFAGDTYGSLDIWVNNAAISSPYGPTVEIVPTSFVGVVNTNILGTYYGSLIALQYFLSKGDGKLINILGAGDRKPVPYQIAYASSKAWMIQFTRALAKENKDSGVGIYALNPGMMDTDLLQNVEVVEGYEHRLDRFENVVRVLSQSPDIPAQKAVWLASDETNGQTGLIVRELTRMKMFRNLMKTIFDRLQNRPQRAVNVRIKRIPSAYKPEENT